MIDASVLSETLEALADPQAARARLKELRPLRGLRGVPDGEVARVLAAAWQDEGVDLVQDERALVELFGASFEDGLVAIGLLAAALPDDPATAWDLGVDWLARLDDPATADALGWYVLGPAALATGEGAAGLAAAATRQSHPAARRAATTAGLAFTPEPLQGPAAAALRARLGERHLRFVDTCADEALGLLATTRLRDEDTGVRKALRRVLRAWAKHHPAGLVAWADEVRGGLPRLLGEEVVRARRRAAREEA